MKPSVTVAIPLHGSARWVDNVVANVRALPPMVTEILISDQTCLDDAAGQLRALLADDPRVVVSAEARGVGFAGHYQMLLERGGGDLFMWMPHDDIFAPSWVPTLAGALAAHPRAWLAFGQVRMVEIDGVTPRANRRFPFAPGEIYRWHAVRMMTGGWSWAPFRGLFRRREILAAPVRFETEHALVGVDKEWIFTVALRAPLVYDDRTTTWKRVYAGSTATSTPWTSRRRGNERQAAMAVLARHGPSGGLGLCLRCYARCAGLPLRGRALAASLLPARLKRMIRRTPRGAPGADPGSRCHGPDR